MADSLDVNGIVERYGDYIRIALTIRRAEEKLLELFKEGKLFGTVHTCIGQEFASVAVVGALQEQDYIFSNHRCHGHFLAYCEDVEGLFAEVMGKATGVCGGRGGSQHLQRGNFFSNGIQGGIVPVTAGLAKAQKIRGQGGIAVVFIGDGTLGEGTVYESMNIASKWELPLLFVCENNLYAQSTSQEQTLAGSIALRAEAFGIEVHQSNTWNWQELLKDAERSVECVRTAGRPIFHQVDTYRLMAHSKGDDNRQQEEVDSYWEKDPLSQLLSEMRESKILRDLLEQVDVEIERAATAAERAKYGALPKSTSPNLENAGKWVSIEFPRERLSESVRRGLRNALETNEQTLLIGEDIESPYGGAFKCTAGLSEEFPGRVRNTPISEAAIAGIGNGLALAGFKPVVEIMFGDFLTLVADQWINHAAKFNWMYNEQVQVPLIIRTPMGGKRGYAATHSQCLEKHFIGVPGTQVLCLHHRYSPALVYEKLIGSIDKPTLVIENKVMYGQYADCEDIPGFRLLFSDEPYPMARLVPALPAQITIVTIGGLSLEAERALVQLFREHEIVADLFLPTQLYPLKIDSIVESARETGRLLVVEEGQGFVSLSSEILAQTAERLEGETVFFGRLVAEPNPIPSARPMEEECLPNTEKIMRKVLEMAGE